MLNKGLGKKLKRIFAKNQSITHARIPRDEHGLSRKLMSPNALKVLYRLKKAGYEAFLVGGGVRDLLLGGTPKDFDVATNGRPEALQELFVNSRIIGRRFRLLHVFYSDEIIEVSTFRANAQDEADRPPNQDRVEDRPVVIAADNTYGTIEEDAWRRDFTVNALYYNIADFSLVDFTGGLSDIKKRLIRMIGDPIQRYHEDPVRLLRAIRLSAKLNFKIETETARPIKSLATLLQHVPESRLFDEFIKLFFDGYAEATYKQLIAFDYMNALFPDFEPCELFALAMRETDRRYHENLSLNPGFLLSVLLWPLVTKKLEINKEKFDHFYQLLHHSIDEVLQIQQAVLRIPKRFTAMMRSIWVMQYQLIQRRGKRVHRTFHHRYFRASYDFLVLRAEYDETLKPIANWWEKFQSASAHEQASMIDKISKRKSR